MSQNTGVAPTIDIHEAVDIQEKLVVITSSPGLIPKHIKEKCNKDNPTWESKINHLFLHLVVLQ